jgi:hypothetical protein
LREIAHLKEPQQALHFRKYSAAPDGGRRGPAVISPRRNRASLAIPDVFGNYVAGFGFTRSLKISAMNDVIQMGLRMALGGRAVDHHVRLLGRIGAIAPYRRESRWRQTIIPFRAQE